MNNEEKILAILERQEETLKQHGELLEKQGETLKQHGELLEKQGEILKRHGELLEKQEETLTQHGEALQKQGELLDKLIQKVSELDERSHRTAVLLEVEVDRKLDTLYEGHGAIMEYLDQLAPKNRVEVLESDVALLKDAFKLMRQEIAELKKAQ